MGDHRRFRDSKVKLPFGQQCVCCCITTLGHNKDDLRRPPLLTRLKTGTVRVQTVAELDSRALVPPIPLAHRSSSGRHNFFLYRMAFKCSLRISLHSSGRSLDMNPPTDGGTRPSVGRVHHTLQTLTSDASNRRQTPLAGDAHRHAATKESIRGNSGPANACD